MLFWTSAIQTTVKLDRMRNAESRLLAFAKTLGDRVSSSYDISIIDTPIQRSALPLKELKCRCKAVINGKHKQNGDDDGVDDDDTKSVLNIHGVRVDSKEIDDQTNYTKTPLVMLHGYMNAGAYFYRNFAGLSKYFQTIYSLDLLGWGLSSRPSLKQLKDNSIETAEDFFVESLETWRKYNKVDKMILLGHSMGGYISVAYSERYPERVEHLMLLSPVGVSDENDPNYQERMKRFQSSWRSRAFLGVFRRLFDMMTIGSFVRSLPEERAYGYARNYVEKRLPALMAVGEKDAVADYLFYNTMLPSSGEQCIHKFLKSNIMAKKPLKDRIPKLAVKNVSFAYGQHDWMDISGGLETQRLCNTFNHNGTNNSDVNNSSSIAPNINVFMVEEAGHLLMLENSKGTNGYLIHANGGKVPSDCIPRLVDPSK